MNLLPRLFVFDFFPLSHSLAPSVIKLKANARCDHINKYVYMYVFVFESSPFPAVDKRHRNTLSHREKKNLIKNVALFPQPQDSSLTYTYVNMYMYVCNYNKKCSRNFDFSAAVAIPPLSSTQRIHNCRCSLPPPENPSGPAENLERFHEFCHALDFKFCRC